MYKKIVSFSLLLGVLTLQAMRVNTEDQDLWVIVDPKDNKEIGYLLTYNGNVPSILTTYATTVIPTAIIENETLHESLLTINAEQNISPERKRLTTALEIMETKNCNVYLETHLKEDYLKKLMPENKISLEYISHFKHGPPEKSSEKILYAIYTEKTVVNQRIAKTKPLPAPYAIYTENIANKFCNLLTQKKYPVYTFDWNLDATSHTHPLTYTHCALKQLFSKEHSVVFYPTVHTLDFHSDSKVIHHKSTSKKSPLINLIAQQALTLATANANIKNEPSILIIRNNYSNSVYKMTRHVEDNNSISTYAISAGNESSLESNPSLVIAYSATNTVMTEHTIQNGYLYKAIAKKIPVLMMLHEDHNKENHIERIIDGIGKKITEIEKENKKQDERNAMATKPTFLTYPTTNTKTGQKASYLSQVLRKINFFSPYAFGACCGIVFFATFYAFPDLFKNSLN